LESVKLELFRFLEYLFAERNKDFIDYFGNYLIKNYKNAQKDFENFMTQNFYFHFLEYFAIKNEIFNPNIF